MTEEHQGTFAKPKPKRQETRKRSPKNHNEKPDVSEAETVTELQLAPKEDKDLLTVLTDEYLGTPKLAEGMTHQSPSHNHIQARPEITFAYYPFLCINNLSSLHIDDINYLESQGCFKLPGSSCLDHPVRAFFNHAHPIFPVVNEAEFCNAVRGKYVDGDVLQGMQHSTAHEARDSFLRKTQLLYDQETETSPVVLAQVSLLLAHLAPQKSSRTNRPSTQWLGRAIHHCQDGIYQAKVSTSVKSHFSQGNLRRLWGCCILSDCIHSLYTRRQLMMPPGRSRVYGVEAKQRFIEAQEQMSALISILRRVLALVYP
ncbi:hypothetical protein FOPG_18532 [Fusarium oxysporum f. sp. conglutinans race 2 54008]|uniref:Transcription factor domain-containing protein n=1 Tax=Fusarium oxysporum f. sp. conglutinans race 2 54008 TaxID=1089457 RepID=X0GZD0_FUSOX|nr:hypothetical protein FOPG_18532 [Fusarium oxysporum f. sp. conglutinans race 2 54008]